MRQKKLTSHVILLLLLVALVSCDIFGVYQGSRQGEEVLYPDADIVLGKRVKQVHLGDSIQTVRRLYGRPKYPSKIFISGVRRSWYGYRYFEGELGGVKFYLNSYVKDGDSYWERVDSSIVDYIAIRSKPLSIDPDISYEIFKGTTHHGIGLGSSRSELIKGLGNPDSISKFENKNRPPVYAWFYCIERNGERNEVQFGIEQDSVFTIGFGFYKEDKVKDCEWLRE